MAFIDQLNSVKNIPRRVRGFVNSINSATGDVAAVGSAAVDTDVTLAANSDVVVASQKATKAFVATAQAAAQTASIPAAKLDTTGTLGTDDTKVASQKATKTYADAALATALAADATLTVASADGAIAVKRGTLVITKAGVAALTLAAPTAGTDDGDVLTIIDVGGNAHTVTTPANKINGAKAVGTFDGTVGSQVQLRAYNGVWYAHNTGVTLT